MKVTMSAIKVDMGSIDGHVQRSRELEDVGAGYFHGYTIKEKYISFVDKN